MRAECVQGEGGGQKRPKECVRTLCMAPNKLWLFLVKLFQRTLNWCILQYERRPAYCLAISHSRKQVGAKLNTTCKSIPNMNESIAYCLTNGPAIRERKIEFFQTLHTPTKYEQCSCLQEKQETSGSFQICMDLNYIWLNMEVGHKVQEWGGYFYLNKRSYLTFLHLRFHPHSHESLMGRL